MATKKPKQQSTKQSHYQRWLKVSGIIVLLIVFVATVIAYSLSAWYAQRHKDDPRIIGTTFITPYAQHFGLDPKDTLNALIHDAGFKHFRLVSYWDEIEKEQGTYDYSNLDWQMKMIEDAGGKVSLAIGLRQPRWPECHMPTWAMNTPMTQWEPQLTDFIKATMNRYKDRPVLESYQLENEFFLDVFGECPDFTRDRLIREYNAAKATDPNHPIIVSRSNNALGYPIGQPRPDEFGVSVYKRVWDKTITKRYFEYPFPAWFYGSLAGGGEIITGKKLIIHELQMEPWLPDDPKFQINEVASIPEQNKSMNAERLKDRFDYANASGIKTYYTWGSEWWYWRKVKGGDDSLWNVAKEEIKKAEEANASR
jgi:Cellulase (glycosyl hydrolase family 5)